MNNGVIMDRRPPSKLFLGARWVIDHWLQVFIVLFGLFWLTPFLAPVLMRLGWETPARTIYTIYSTQCHQMANRSFFFYGTKFMYSPAELPVVLTDNEAANLLALREFIGNAQFGWKVAWSDRMISMYGGIWFASIGFWLRRQNYHPRSLYTLLFSVLLIPMVVDGTTHLLSDVTGGIFGGFRYTNQWLADLSNHALPAWFYVGDSLGSFNSWLRLLTGLFFGIGIVGLAIPIFDRALQELLAKHNGIATSGRV